MEAMSSTFAGEKARGGVSNATPRVARRRKLFYLLDSLNVGGTETQAVELACRLDPAVYDVTLGCLQARGPLLEKLQRTSVHLEEFHPKGGVDSVRGMYQLFR